jgi:hypothetical protein
MRWIAAVLFPAIALGSSATVKVPEGTRVRVRLARTALPKDAGGGYRLPVSEPVIVNGAVVMDRNAEVQVTLHANRLAAVSGRVQASDGGWIALKPAQTQPGGRAELDFYTAAAAEVEAKQSLRFDAVDYGEEAYRRLSRWAWDIHASWAMALFESGGGPICLTGFLLIAIGLAYRALESRRERV